MLPEEHKAAVEQVAVEVLERLLPALLALPEPPIQAEAVVVVVSMCPAQLSQAAQAALASSS